MFVELHILQNFAPSNLNRDDTGMPKDCEFGGYRRARISSQCLKRAVRREPEFSHFLEGIGGGVRTKNLAAEIGARIEAAIGNNRAVKEVMEILKDGGILEDAKSDGKTNVILYLDRAQIDDLVNLFVENWEQLAKGSKDTKNALREKLGETLVKAARVPDIALFGRMIVVKNNTPFGKLHLNVDAASQFAHAISTNSVNMEFDYFSAVEELPQPEESGASYIDSAGFNSACFYRYANVDMGQLTRNLQGDDELAQKTLEAFIRASVSAVPTGKQNSMAAHNPPSFVLAVVRRSSLWNLANAFLKPVAPSREEDLALRSIKALDSYWGKLARMYGDHAVVGKWAVSLEEDGVDNLRGGAVPSVDALVENVLGEGQG